MTQPQKDLLRLIQRNAFYTGLVAGLGIGGLAVFVIGIVAHALFHL